MRPKSRMRKRKLPESSAIATRQAYSVGRLEGLVEGMKKNGDVPNLPKLCTYVTGSYGRLEAHAGSDLDIFFIHAGAQKTESVSKVDKALMDAALIKTSRLLSFPDFTKGGLYLEIHSLKDMLERLGSPTDDYQNLFTARMLLLLESKPLINVGVYNHVVKTIVNTYFRDYHDHEKEFRPIFLVNDIQRYWKTMCLNYENQRNLQVRSRQARNKVHLKNFKLKYSRLLTCYSMLLRIVAKPGAMSPDEIIALVHETPVERLRGAW